MTKRPAPDECNEYYHNYIRQVEGNDVLSQLRAAKTATAKYLEALTEKQWSYRYAPGKWTAKEAFLHIIDGERIFAYRALRIARNDATPLPGFEQNDYVPASDANNRSAASLLEEYRVVREASLLLLENLSPEAWDRRGTASGYPVTVRALAYLIAGHEAHHMGIFKARYFPEHT